MSAVVVWYVSLIPPLFSQSDDHLATNNLSITDQYGERRQRNEDIHFDDPESLNAALQISQASLDPKNVHITHIATVPQPPPLLSHGHTAANTSGPSLPLSIDN